MDFGISLPVSAHLACATSPSCSPGRSPQLSRLGSQIARPSGGRSSLGPRASATHPTQRSSRSSERQALPVVDELVQV